MTDTPLAELSPTAESSWQQWCDWAAEQGIAVPEDAAFSDARAKAFEASEFVCSQCARAPQQLADLIESRDLIRSYEPGEQSRMLGAALDEALGEAVNEDALKRVLRQFRNRAMVRIIWRDIGGLAPLAETLEDLSALADACIQLALEHLERWTRAEFGTPRAADGRELSMVVIGMGKLGARELNLSSDIDLIFGYREAGSCEGGRRKLTAEQFFIRLGQRLVQALNPRTVDGFVFRVDTRLRPFGDAGPLAMSFDAMETYYESQAREWERYAMIKARVIAADPADADELRATLTPFVYRRYLDFGAIESLREMKGMIDRELKRKGMADNVKLGPGGIREIEFIGQAFQLIRGGRDPELRVLPILEVLGLLGRKDLMPEETVVSLAKAYEVLRLVENRVQAWRDDQTHLLPRDDTGQLRLARSMDFSAWAPFIEELDRHRGRVQSAFDDVFAPQRDGAEPAAGPFDQLWTGGMEQEPAEALLAEHDFEDAVAALARLNQCREAVERKGLSTKGRERLNQLMPALLEEVAASEAPQTALPRVLSVVETVMRRTAYLALMAEHREVLRHLVMLTAKSPWFVEQIIRQPLLLDELLDARRLFEPLRRAELVAELDALLAHVDSDDLEQQMERLRQFVQGNQLRVAATDLSGRARLMRVSDFLTEIAEVAVSRVVDITYAGLLERHGRPAGLATEGCGFLVLGYGKLGGIELGYGSDLDLVFLHGSDSISAMTAGPKSISNDQFYMRLGQRMIHIMTTRSFSGELYEIDMRLRPDGNKGMLVRSLGSFGRYQREDAWTWEHQALVRARPVSGDPALFEPFEAIRREVLCRERDPAKVREEVRRMRERMRESLDKSSAEGFDLKQGRGGIADIEFMVQYAVLRWAHLHPDLARWTDNIRLLETLSAHDLLPGAAAEDLTGAYKALRRAYHRSALTDRPTVVEVGELTAERERVRELWRSLMEQGAAD